MFEILLAIVAIAIWASIFIYYFRDPIYEWLDNRFGKDTPLADPEAPTKQNEPPTQKPSKG
ncbi:MULTISPECIES: hypothetical protein [Acetobacter]|uniref:Uncharacterized protein n=1 Tax=Acetobacter ascendens TaxID=481146 RepID=A0A1D8QVW9_9PROT|nr:MULTISPECIES: hypothetical protein [Acetobacter]AOW46495.1 hypothetical protein A4S02_06635 [Acetobacter ascendens]RCL07023.1 hypothetical protein BBA71_05835 [Acetobacter pasteurianus]GCD56271.1 hypothetical protein NBRC3222_1608 [Acetobacter pasteurianus NBRC 3222]